MGSTNAGVEWGGNEVPPASTERWCLTLEGVCGPEKPACLLPSRIMAFIPKWIPRGHTENCSLAAREGPSGDLLCVQLPRTPLGEGLLERPQVPAGEGLSGAPSGAIKLLWAPQNQKQLHLAPSVTANRGRPRCQCISSLHRPRSPTTGARQTQTRLEEAPGPREASLCPSLLSQASSALRVRLPCVRPTCRLPLSLVICKHIQKMADQPLPTWGANTNALHLAWLMDLKICPGLREMPKGQSFQGAEKQVM